MKVTEVPAQTGLADDAIDILTGRLGLTVIVNAAEVAGFPVVQVALEVSVQVIKSLFDGTYVKTGLSVPAIVPLTFH